MLRKREKETPAEEIGQEEPAEATERGSLKKRCKIWRKSGREKGKER